MKCLFFRSNPFIYFFPQKKNDLLKNPLNIINTGTCPHDLNSWMDVEWKDFAYILKMVLALVLALLVCLLG